MKKLILAIAIAAVAAALVLGPSILASGKGSAGGDLPGKSGANADEGDTQFSVRLATAASEILQVYIEVNGDVTAETEVDIVPDAAGKLVTLKVDVGSTVSKGELIAEVDPSKPGTTYSLSPILAPISGTVTSAPLSVGATVSTATTVATIGVVDKLEVEAKIPERDVGQLKAGLRAQVSLEAFPGESFAAQVYRLSPVVDPSSRTKTIVLRFDRQDPRVNAGMFAKIKLDTIAYPDRIAVPEEALIDLKGAKYVYVARGDNTVELRQVTPGVAVDGRIEIAAGLAAGESVVIAGQQLLSDGARIRVVGADGSQS